MQLITSVHNPKIKAAVRLRQRRFREQQGLTIIDGNREIERALTAGVKFSEAFVLQDSASSNQPLIDRIRESNDRVYAVNQRVFEKLSFGNRCEGIVALAETPRRVLRDLPETGDVIIGVLESLEKPGNVGAIVRSADAAGIDALIVANPATDLFNPNTIRASLGTIFSMKICAASSEETRTWLKETSTRVFAARVDAAAEYTDADMRGRVAVVLGSEAEGVSSCWQDSTISGVRLPMLGIADSLNVSVAAGILFYEALRQRTNR